MNVLERMLVENYPGRKAGSYGRIHRSIICDESLLYLVIAGNGI